MPAHPLISPIPPASYFSSPTAAKQSCHSSLHLSRRDINKMIRQGDWVCSSCQHINFKKRDSCQRCGCSKFGGGTDVSSYGINRTEPLAGDWYCNAMNCGAHNYASRTICYRCGSTKEDYGGFGGGMLAPGGHPSDATVLPGWKSGDWICTRHGCGVHNYASRTECFRCGSPRDLGGAGN